MKNKRYEKALYLYGKGNIEKAIEICEKEISRDLKNSNVINLKGVLLYLKGELEDAIALWSINKDYNNDDISSSYLNDSRNDFRRKELYLEAEELIHNLEIDEAIRILNICRESDFNSINVNNALAKCYLKKGDYESVRECLECVFKLDKYNVIAKEINKELKGAFKYNDKDAIFNRVMIVLALSVAVIMIVFIGNKNLFNNELKNQQLQTTLNTLEEDKESQESKENIIVINDNTEDINEEIINQEVISNKNFSDDEIREIYIKATDFFDEGKYIEAREILDEVIDYLNGSHLDDDIIFLLGSVCDEIGDIDEAVKNFDRYISEYADGSYIIEAYYKAALLYRDKNISISKSYANEILINYPDSIYNNSYIEEIVGS